MSLCFRDRSLFFSCSYFVYLSFQQFWSFPRLPSASLSVSPVTVCIHLMSFFLNASFLPLFYFVCPLFFFSFFLLCLFVSSSRLFNCPTLTGFNLCIYNPLPSLTSHQFICICPSPVFLFLAFVPLAFFWKFWIAFIGLCWIWFRSFVSFFRCIFKGLRPSFVSAFGKWNKNSKKDIRALCRGNNSSCSLCESTSQSNIHFLQLICSWAAVVAH